MRILIAALATASLVGPVSAADSSNYFLEGLLSGGGGNMEVGTEELDFTHATVDLTYYLSSISTYDLPLSETQFLNRPSFIGFSQKNITTDPTMDASGGEISGDRVSRELRAGSVMGSGSYFGLNANLVDDSDLNTYELQYGTYMDESTSAFIGYVVDSLEDVNVFTIGMHYAAPYGADQAWIAYDFGGKYILDDDNNEYGVNIGVAYYPGYRSALGIVYDFTDNQVAATNNTNLYGEYFITPKLSTRLDLNQYKAGSTTENSAGLSLRLRY